LCNGNDDDMTTEEYVASFGQRQQDIDRKWSALSFKASRVKGPQRRRPFTGWWPQRKTRDGLRRRGVDGRRRQTNAAVDAAYGRKFIGKLNSGSATPPQPVTVEGRPSSTRRWIELNWRTSLAAAAVSVAWTRVRMSK
jgi:hypothetical protein